MAKIITAPGLGEAPPPADAGTVDGPPSSTGGEAPLPKARFGTDPRSAMSPEAALLRTVKPKAKAGVGGLRDKLQDATREDVRVVERNAALVRLKADRSEAPTVPERAIEPPSSERSHLPKVVVAALVLLLGIVAVLALRGKERVPQVGEVPSPSALLPPVATAPPEPGGPASAPITPPPAPSAPAPGALGAPAPSAPVRPKASTAAPPTAPPAPAAPPPSAAPATPAPPDSSGPSPNPWKIKEHRT